MKLRPAVKATGIDRELWNAAMKLADYEGFVWHGRSIGARYV